MTADLRIRLEQEIVPCIAKHFQFCSTLRIYLFGSQATGESDRRSDIDIGIDCNGKKIPLAELQRIREKVEDTTMLQKIDIVDFNAVSEAFRSIAKESEVLVYER